MKTLLVNPGYPQTFWSFASVARMLGKRAVLPPLGLLTLAALLPRDWEIALVDLAAGQGCEADWERCDLVLVTGMHVQREGILEAIRRGKQHGKTVVVGGPWVFHSPQAALAAGADIVVRGEGENTVPLLLEALRAGRSGVVVEAAAGPDLKSSPTPRHDLLDAGRYMDMAVQFSRGCPFQCEFCDITLMFGRRVRTKSPGQILAELQSLHDLGWRRTVFFVDDNLIGNPPRAKELLRELIPWMEQRKHPFDFYTQASVNLAADDELLDLMVRAGFRQVFLGIETTDVGSLKQAKKFQNAAVDLGGACEKINRSGLEIIAGCIVGFDNEERGADRRLIEFALANQIPEMFVTLLQAAPGTDLWGRLEREGRLLNDGTDEGFLSQTALINFVPTRPTAEIVAEFVRVYEELYEPRAYLGRAFGHLSRMAVPPPRRGLFLPTLREIRGVANTILRHGVLYSSRGVFWRYLFTALRRFPERSILFLIYCLRGEHYYTYRRTVKAQLQELLDARGVEAPFKRPS